MHYPISSAVARIFKSEGVAVGIEFVLSETSPVGTCVRGKSVQSQAGGVGAAAQAAATKDGRIVAIGGIAVCCTWRPRVRGIG